MTDRRLYAVVLAAGASSRFGATKQVAEVNGVSLVARATRTAESVCGSDVVLVTGNDWRTVTGAATPMAGYFVVNPRYGEGLSTSIACGIRVLPNTADAALIVLADQPLVTTDYLQVLAATWRDSPESIVASTWDDVSGPPAIFPRSAFSDLASLSGDAGARKIIQSGKLPVLNVDFAGGAVDIDRPEDLDKLRGIDD